MGSLDSVEIKLARARDHYQILDAHWQALQEAHPYRFDAEVHDDGIKHVYRAVEPAPLPPYLAGIVGDFAHNLRSALDHLAWLLVQRNRGQPGEATQFPVRASRIVHDPCSGGAQPAPLTISGGVSAEALKKLDAVQPYNAPNGHRNDLLWLLHRLDVIDKHRHLVLHAVAVHGFRQTLVVGDLGEMPSAVVTGRPLKHREIVLVLTYPTPRAEPNPQVQIYPSVVFGQGAPKALIRAGVQSAMGNIYVRVEEVVDLFRPMFEKHTIGNMATLRLTTHAPTPSTVEEARRRYGL